AARFIRRFIALRARLCIPGVSTNTICASGSLRIPRMRCRVVCGRGVTMLTFVPTSALISVDLPTFGRPTTATKPARNAPASPAIDAPLAILHEREHLRRRLLLRLPPRAAPAERHRVQRRDAAAHFEGLAMRLPGHRFDVVRRQLDLPRLQ